MIYIGFVIRNPWLNRYRTIKEWSFKVSQHKSIDFCIYKDNSIIGCAIDITAGLKRDHAGFHFDVQLLGYNIDFIFYDNRHYDERTN